jgi:glucokinase
VCRLTNVDWDIDGNALSQSLGIPAVVINDFTGISYGIPLLDVRNPERILTLPQPDGSVPPQRGSRKAVVGAGTGLGVGHVSFEHGRYVAFPSEGGHSDFAPAPRNPPAQTTRFEGFKTARKTIGPVSSPRRRTNPPPASESWTCSYARTVASRETWH